MNDANLKKALVLMNRSQLSAYEIESLRAVLNVVNIRELLSLAEDNACQVLLLKNIQLYNLNKFFENCSRFSEFAAQAFRLEERAQRRTREARRFLQACADAKQPIVLLKGSMLGSSVYQDANYKKMNDIDFLVHPSSIDAVKTIMEHCGFRSVGRLFADHEMDHKRNHHLSPYVNQDNSCILGLHWHLSSPYSRWKPDFSKLWADKVPFLYDQDIPVYRLSWEHNLAHLCMHLPYYKLGLRELADVFNLVFDQPIDWQKFLDCIHSWNIEDPTWRVLKLAQAWSECPVPEEVLLGLQLKVNKETLEDTNRRTQKTYRLLRSRSVYIGKIEKAFGLFRLTEVLSDRIKAFAYIWFKTLWVSKQEIPKLLAMSEHESIQFQQSNPLKILKLKAHATQKVWNAMARDYGHAALSFIAVTNILILIKSLMKAPFPPYKRDNLTSLKELQSLLE